MTAKWLVGALALAMVSTPAAAERWQPLDFGPANLATAMDVHSVVDSRELRSAWFAISRLDLRGVARVIRKERHEFECRNGASRLSAWGDFFPDGKLAAAGRSPAELKPVDFNVRGSHASELWRAACGPR